MGTRQVNMKYPCSILSNTMHETSNLSMSFANYSRCWLHQGCHNALGASSALISKSVAKDETDYRGQVRFGKNSAGSNHIESAIPF